MRSKTFLILPMVVGWASACSILEPNRDYACPAVAYDYPPPVNVAIRDEAGAATALGADVIFAAGSWITVDSTLSDTLVVSGGTYNTKTGVLVSKKYYIPEQYDTVVRGTFTSCGKPEHLDPPVTLNVTLKLIPGAPPVRALYLRAVGGLDVLDRVPGRDSIIMKPWLDADENVPHAVSWRVTGDTASIFFNPATGVASYRCRSTSGIVNVTAVSVMDTTVRASITLRVQEHPASSGDPPCS